MDTGNWVGTSYFPRKILAIQPTLLQYMPKAGTKVENLTSALSLSDCRC